MLEFFRPDRGRELVEFSRRTLGEFVDDDALGEVGRLQVGLHDVCDDRHGIGAVEVPAGAIQVGNDFVELILHRFDLAIISQAGEGLLDAISLDHDAHACGGTSDQGDIAVLVDVSCCGVGEDLAEHGGGDAVQLDGPVFDFLVLRLFEEFELVFVAETLCTFLVKVAEQLRVIELQHTDVRRGVFVLLLVLACIFVKQVEQPVQAQRLDKVVVGVSFVCHLNNGLD